MPYGKDGTFYNDWKEMRRADEACYQRDKNNKLLQEQNKMKKKEIENKNSLKTVHEEIKNTNNNQVKIQQLNMSQDNAQKYLDRGIMYLEDENTEKAIEFFENNQAKVEHQENEELKSKQKIQELCRNFEQNHKNMQEENYKIVQELFKETKEEIQQLKNNKLNLKKEILKLETKLNSLGLFKSNEKKNIKNEIENKNRNISEMLKTTQKLKENCKKEIINLYEQEQEDIEGWKELLKETDDIFLKEQMNLVLKNLDVDIEDEIDPILSDYKNIEKILSNGEISTSLIQRRFQVGYTRARKNSRPTGRKRYNFCL